MSLQGGKIDFVSIKVAGETPFLSVVRYCGTIVHYGGGQLGVAGLAIARYGPLQ